MALQDRALQTLDLLQQNSIGTRPTVFVCHSLGGLLAKALLRRHSDLRGQTDTATDLNVVGIVFLATPHAGSEVASTLRHLSMVLRLTVSVSDLRADSPVLLDLYEWFRRHAEDADIRLLSYTERRPVAGLVDLVTPSSAHPGVGPAPIPLDEDHLSIAKPLSTTSQQYAGVLRFILDCDSTQRQQAPTFSASNSAKLPAKATLRSKTSGFVRLTSPIMLALAAYLFLAAPRPLDNHPSTAFQWMFEEAVLGDSRPTAWAVTRVAAQGGGAIVSDLSSRWQYAAESLVEMPQLRARYGGLKLVSHDELVPLGRNPETGLLEFYHWPSGTVPLAPSMRTQLAKWGTHAYDGKPKLDRDIGLILVLVPGSHTPAATAPAIAPFFLSRYEVTSDQWVRMRELCDITSASGRGPIEATGTYPAMYLTWFEAYAASRAFGLRLPSKAEWLVAAAELIAGEQPSDVALLANLRDISARNAEPTKVATFEQWDDGAPFVMPVQALRSNSLGLHHMLGNVAEYCDDVVSPDQLASTVPRGKQLRSVMGGDYTKLLSEARGVAAIVASDTGSRSVLSIGLRPALSLRLE
jgi:hypothetical protein